MGNTDVSSPLSTLLPSAVLRGHAQLGTGFFERRTPILRGRGTGRHPNLTSTCDIVTSDANVRARGPAIFSQKIPWEQMFLLSVEGTFRTDDLTISKKMSENQWLNFGKIVEINYLGSRVLF